MSKYDKNIPFNALPPLPPRRSIESHDILKETIRANRLLGELKGYCQTLPNPEILLNTIVLQESKESSAIENIVTTQDELYKAALDMANLDLPANTREVLCYREAMYWGMRQIEKKKMITTNIMVGIMQQIKNTRSGVRTQPGTRLANPTTKSIIYTPPEGEQLIREKLADLERFINIDHDSDLDPLIKLALIHYQFEAIHPFSDGNGRTGRILNVLYLVQQGLLSLPVLYLSKYIIQHKADYYRLLREVTEKQQWEPWIHYILRGIAETAQVTLKIIEDILHEKQQGDGKVKSALGSSYSREITDLIFSFPYIKIKTLELHGIAKRQTASTYLQKIAETKLLDSLKIGKETYYINQPLMKILTRP